jgi:hypothetical protein
MFSKLSHVIRESLHKSELGTIQRKIARFIVPGKNSPVLGSPAAKNLRLVNIFDG